MPIIPYYILAKILQIVLSLMRTVLFSIAIIFNKYIDKNWVKIYAMVIFPFPYLFIWTECRNVQIIIAKVMVEQLLTLM